MAHPPRADAKLQTAITDFNIAIRLLINDIADSMPGDAEIDRIRRRVMLVLNFTPALAIQAVGHYLYAYHELIYQLEDEDPAKSAQAEKFFIENPFNAELGASSDPEKRAMVAEIIPKMKRYAKSLPADRMVAYKQRIVDLLDRFIDYRAAGGEL